MFTMRLLLIGAAATFMTSCDDPKLRAKAEAGDARAQHAYGNLLMNGKGLVLRDMAAAHKWWRKAANQGYIMSQITLGGRYEQGDFGFEGGVKKDDVESYAWLTVAANNVAADKDPNQPVNGTDEAKKYRDEVGKRLTPEQKARSLQRAAELQKEIDAHQKSVVK
jgi:TPR repeat protein